MTTRTPQVPYGPLYPANDLHPHPHPHPLPPPILETPNLIIRPYHTCDIEPCAGIANNPLISQWMRDTFPSPYTQQDASFWINLNIASPGPIWNFAILLKRTNNNNNNNTGPDETTATGQLIGSIGLKPLTDIEARTMEVGYWLGQPYWGKGYAGEALTAFTRWSFQAIPHLNRLEAVPFEGNVGSRRVLEKCGFVYEGMRRGACYKNGKICGLLVFGILREEVDGVCGKDPMISERLS